MGENSTKKGDTAPLSYLMCLKRVFLININIRRQFGRSRWMYEYICMVLNSEHFLL